MAKGRDRVGQDQTEFFCLMRMVLAEPHHLYFHCTSLPFQLHFWSLMESSQGWLNPQRISRGSLRLSWFSSMDESGVSLLSEGKWGGWGPTTWWGTMWFFSYKWCWPHEHQSPPCRSYSCSSESRLAGSSSHWVFWRVASGIPDLPLDSTAMTVGTEYFSDHLVRHTADNIFDIIAPCQTHGDPGRSTLVLSTSSWYQYLTLPGRAKTMCICI